MSLAPATGATLDVIVCTFGMERPLCAPDAVVTAAATYDQDIALASVFTEYFTGDGRLCASGSALSARMGAGMEQQFAVTPAFVSFRTDDPPICPLPVTTSRVRLILVDATTSEFRRLVTVDVDATYTFRMKTP